jgi:trimeric autotransporter adhesin
MAATQQQDRSQKRIARRNARVARREERHDKQVESFVGPYTPRQAKRIARKTVAAEFRPTERQIGSEIRGSKKQEREIGGDYDQLAADYATAGQSAATAADQANAAVAASLKDSSANTASLLQGLAAQDSQFAAQVGGPVDTAGQQKAAEAAAAAERMRAALQAPSTAARAINVAGYGGKVATTALAGIAAKKAEAANRSKERFDLRSLRGEHGAALTKEENALRELSENYLTQQAALGVKKDETAAKAGYNKAIEKQTEAGLKGSYATAAATEAAARAYAAAKERGASSQEAVAAANKAAAAISAKSNENVARTQGENAAKKAKSSGGYTIPEAAKLLRASGGSFKTPGEAVQYLVNRGVKEAVAKKAVHRVIAAGNAPSTKGGIVPGL